VTIGGGVCVHVCVCIYVYCMPHDEIGVLHIARVLETLIIMYIGKQTSILIII